MNMHIISGSRRGYKPQHKSLIINHLLSGKTITQAIFCDMTSKASRLAPRILELRQAGYPIQTDRIKLDDGTFVANYYLPAVFILIANQLGLEQALAQYKELP